MEKQRNIQNLFNLRVYDCNHILNTDYHKDSKIQDIPLHKGNLFLGGVGSFKQPILNGYRITAVLSILDKKMMERYMIKQKVQHLRVQKHKWIDLQDKENMKISEFFQQSHKFIKQELENHNVLVHCQVGMSRSATLVISYLMKEYGLNYEAAYKLVKKKRNCIEPNNGFVKQLLEYEKNNSK